MSRRIPEHTLTVEQQELVRRLIAETQERIHQDYKKAPLRLRPFLLYIKREIFNPEFAIGAARRASGLGSDYSTKFYALTGKRPRDYVEHHRIMLARSIIRYTPMLLWQVGQKVGFNDQSVFTRRYEKVVGHPPKKEARTKKSELPRRANAIAEISPPDSHTLDPRLSPDTAELGTEPPRLDLKRFWDEIRGKDCMAIRRYLFEHIDVVEVDHFHYLLEKAKYEGRRDRARGEELSLAALDALRLVEIWKGEEFPDEKAIGYASLGNQRRLRFDHAGAEKAFEKAEGYLPREPGQRRFLVARVHLLKIPVLWHMRDVETAKDVFDSVLPVIQEHGSSELIARTFLLGGQIFDATGHLERAVKLFSEAMVLSRFVDDSYVVFSAAFNLTSAYTRLSMATEAAASFEEVQALSEAVLGDNIPFHVAHLEGLVRMVNHDRRWAEIRLLEAREGFLNQGLEIYAAVVGLDLSLLYLELDLPTRAFSVAMSAIPPLSECGSHPEAISALAILQEAQRAQSINKSSLQKAISHLDLVRKDPTVNFLWKQ